MINQQKSQAKAPETIGPAMRTCFAGPVCHLAVTGGIAEGKSTVVGYLREEGVSCLSADDLARDVLSRPDIQRAVARLGPTDPPSMSKKLATDPAYRRALNLVVHPAVLELIISDVRPVVEVPLLFEACLQGLFRRVWVVTCGPEEQLRRLVERTGCEETARRLIDAQLPSDVKCAFADEIVRTNQPPKNVHNLVVSIARAEGLT